MESKSAMAWKANRQWQLTVTHRKGKMKIDAAVAIEGAV
jgi:hypothetical protein